MRTVKTTVYVNGMTCGNCKAKIEKKLHSLDSVINVRVDLKEGTAYIEYDSDSITIEEISNVINNLGYEVSNNKSDNDMYYIISISVIIISLYIILQKLGILNYLAPTTLADSQMGYGMLFVIGLITSVHCVAMCGGINLSQSIVKDSRANAFKPVLLYNVGRVISYTLIGFVLGGIGMIIGANIQFGVSILFQGVLKIAVGLFMIIMGINVLGIFPKFRGIRLYMPKFIIRAMAKESFKSRSPFIVGLINGFMPCGPLQSMEILALGTGSALVGGLSMLFFSLGTVPLMAGLGAFVAVLGIKFTQKIMKCGGVLIAVLGMAMLSQGASLSGLIGEKTILIGICILFVVGIIIHLPIKKAYYKNALAVVASVAIIFAFNFNINNNESSAKAKVVNGTQIVTTEISSGNYPNISVEAGIPVKWVINVPEGSINGCNYKMIINEYGIEHSFKEGENVIEFTPKEKGNFSYSCWMGMIRGNITVI